ncbi:RHS repeat-associated core domain-containing protein [Bryobacter aggregatus]|uniref:RHS repeat-associated core domain-containing protein n=1 Tax=Bryobacter aggregatus TaxID=360054 RepID=UPI00138DD768|nr:RHS repeat-associated core domain-containing protein [Bryobacter aggregatus]
MNAATIVTSYSAGTLSVQWGAASDNVNGIGRVRYEVYKGSTYLGETGGTTWTMAAGPGEVFNVGIKAYDGHRNFASVTTKSVSIAPSNSGIWDDSRRVGVHGLGSYWGGMGEQIDTRSMNLNFSLPLLSARARNASVPVGISYNSQNWRYDGAVWQPGGDVGYGFGWRLMVGSISPVWATPTSFSYYLFTDATGAEYKLDVNNSGVWSSKESVYLWYDSNAQRLYFKSGDYWQLDSVSGASEQDAGTRYPTKIYDRHGNYVKIQYKPQIGGGTANTSARIDFIDDIRSTAPNSYQTYRFTYNSDSIPHLTGIANTISTGEAYTFTYSASATLYEPFGSTAKGSFVKLASLTQNGVNLAHSFESNSSGELTKVIYPYGGELRWNYGTQNFASSMRIRVVTSRDFLKVSGATPVNYPFTHPGGDSSLKMHSQTTLSDPGGVGKRIWSFATSNDFKIGLQTVYEEQDNSGGSWLTKSKSESTWAQSASSNTYVSESLSTTDQGQTYQKQSKTTQTIDEYGNLTNSTLYGYNSLSTAMRTTTCVRGGDLNYTTRYLRNLPGGCTVTENGVTIYPQSFDADGYWGNGFTMADLPSGSRLWDDPGHPYRGLVTQFNDGYTLRYASYNKAGQTTGGSDSQGFSQAITYGGSSGSVVPTQMTPNGNSALGTSLSWNGFLGLTQTQSGSGTTASYGYDSYARPSGTTSPDGASTTFYYSNSPAFSTATTNGRTTKTYYDGVGRPIKTELYDASGTKSIVETEYDSCACSPMGKLKRSSLPYAPGGTVYWTTYTYDGLGRTLSVAQPNNSGTTTYLYEGNTVKVTSPSGKWKKYEMDAVGRMTLVTEPRPGSGTYTTNYSYNITGKLTGVSMPRDGVTQTRSFTYDTTTQSRLLSATNPENGTVSYVYNADGTAQSKTDAKGIKSEFVYDSYKRVTQTKKSTQSGGTWTEDRCQRVDYKYDEGGGANNGRLTKTRWSWTVDGSNNEVACPVSATDTTLVGFEESYTYNTAGRVMAKTVSYTRKPWSGATYTANLTANWTYNNEGKITSIAYPEHYESQFYGRRQVQHGFDTLGRLNAVDTKLGNIWDNNPAWQSVVSGVSYNAFGAITALTQLGVSETRQYNVLGQMTRMTKGSSIDVEYRFSATANDGKIVSQKNWLTGEDVTYQYDELERLISAATTNNTSWGLSFSYDGFGNRLAQSVTQGTGPVNTVLVNGNTNRISSSGYSYDANGNMTQMPNGGGSMTMNYDYSNRLATATYPSGSEDYKYAPDNRRIWRSNGRTNCQSADNDGNIQSGGGEGQSDQLIFYSPGGQKMGVYCVSYASIPNILVVTAHEENVYFGARLVGKRIYQYGVTTVSAFTSDRLQSKGNGSAFYPYGESKTGAAGDDKEQFATYTRDAGTGLDYADQRWYASGLGRFTTVDPGTSISSHSGRPESWHGYSYASNNPALLYDPKGLLSEDPCEGGYDLLTDVAYGCASHNGGAYFWFSYDPVFTVTGTGTAPVDPTPSPQPGYEPSSFNPAFYDPSHTAPVLLAEDPDPGNDAAPDNGRNCSAGPASAGQYAAATAQVAALTAQFASGLGPTNQTFGPGTSISAVMGQSAGVTEALGAYMFTGQTSGLYTFGASGAYVAGGNPVAQFIGSFRWSISGGVLSVTNTTSLRSLTYDHGPQYQRRSFPVPGGNIRQTIQIGVTCR